MELADALAYARERRQAVLVTQRSDGRPQLSNVLAHTDDHGLVRVSVTSSRAKYKNLVREPWAALHVTASDFWSYVVLEGDVELSDVVTAPDDAAADELVELYRALAGEHADWDEYRASLVEEGRVVVRLRPTRAYGMLPRD